MSLLNGEISLTCCRRCKTIETVITTAIITENKDTKPNFSNACIFKLKQVSEKMNYLNQSHTRSV